MIEIRMYQTGDYESIEHCVEPDVQLETFDPNQFCGVFLTVTEDQKPIGCGGIIMTSETEGEVWLRLSKTLCQSPIYLYRILKEGYNIVEKSFDLTQLILRIQEQFIPGHRLAERLGFCKTDHTQQLSRFTYRIYEKCLSQQS